MSDEEQKRAIAAVGTAVVELLQASVYAILATRGVYPAHLFEKRLVFGVPTYWPRAEALEDYVRNGVTFVQSVLQQGKLFNFFVTILNKGGDPVERFIFDIDAASPDGKHMVAVDVLERQFRSVLVKLSMCDALLSDKGDGLQFALYATTDCETEAVAARHETNPWIVADQQDCGPHTHQPAVLRNTTTSTTDVVEIDDDDDDDEVENGNGTRGSSGDGGDVGGDHMRSARGQLAAKKEQNEKKKEAQQQQQQQQQQHQQRQHPRMQVLKRVAAHPLSILVYAEEV
ncbi:hypothetical protein PTSG_07870 [Salpingoeca rosetta]|uniref:HORMA domain-containing protein n=1 Tax=Salpingoeca rosetta (strain ATCC 50818 / BSB-021) TaxID=946362 RepID=F2UGK3_SALR5|nr:uncharacterized protein PTSG_07870 [Salpingoeca rosetta]EGD75753.1 hypothetical protein PTSG_07870 [Salpingoeca rosetta]|eukprot:XP_004991674.1 hypothetical protein PTSG_07870 [Salpingoeca rosetta]